MVDFFNKHLGRFCCIIKNFKRFKYSLFSFRGHTGKYVKPLLRAILLSLITYNLVAPCINCILMSLNFRFRGFSIFKIIVFTNLSLDKDKMSEKL